MNKKLRQNLHEISTYCFRDVADNDYLSARILFRNKLIPQAYWSSQQAVEKYFKSILLYNEISIKSLRHDLLKALKKIEQIHILKFVLPEDVREIIIELDNEGTNRYFEYPFFYSKLTYFNHDKVIWNIRRYCIPSKSFFKLDDDEINLSEFEIENSKNVKYIKNPSKYHLPYTGILEKILKDKNSKLREQLVWKNQFYGERQKRKLKNVSRTRKFGNPSHFNGEFDISEINKFVPFSKEVLNYLKKEV